jgi:hypothetical protein
MSPPRSGCCCPPNLTAGGDVTDWLKARGTVEELHRLADASPYSRKQNRRHLVSL